MNFSLTSSLSDQPAVPGVIHCVAAVLFSNLWKPTAVLCSPLLLDGPLHHKLQLFILCWSHDFDFETKDGIKGADRSVKLILSSHSIYYSFTGDNNCQHICECQREKMPWIIKNKKGYCLCVHTDKTQGEEATPWHKKRQTEKADFMTVCTQKAQRQSSAPAPKNLFYLTLH